MRASNLLGTTVLALTLVACSGPNIPRSRTLNLEVHAISSEDVHQVQMAGADCGFNKLGAVKTDTYQDSILYMYSTDESAKYMSVLFFKRLYDRKYFLAEWEVDRGRGEPFSSIAIERFSCFERALQQRVPDLMKSAGESSPLRSVK